MDWSLTFRESRPVTIEMCQSALVGFAGCPVSTKIPPYGGNPRDGFFREVTLTAPMPALTLVLELVQEGWSDNDQAEATTSLLRLRLVGGMFATKLATWRALGDAFAPLGWTDQTLINFPSPIVDDAEAVGEYAIAKQLRADITAARIADAKRPDHFQVDLRAPRADDLEAVLEAYVDPARIVYVKLVDCGLTALPRAFHRFPNLEIVDLDHNPIDATALRFTAPNLCMLSLSFTGITSLAKSDLAAFPALKHVGLAHAPLRDLDPDIIEACPHLTQVVIEGTQLAEDKIAALRARWTNVKL